ncbi:unnamed protein product [Candidula unifasciata]|uniref:Uncharacterized protein n=1 Tax=Candidula unifasciata TaxID=100452 RepID=A0A8S3ZR33_9EUPU|nr:unnamed protein product [Candidula unifasciata]
MSELKTFVNDPLFTPENVAQASLAASSVCAWVHALYAYSSIHQKMKPHMKSLVDAENKLAKAQAQLGQLRLEASQMKNNLEQYISQHKEAVKAAKAIEKQILAIERKIARASNLMENMSVQHFLWRSELKRTRKKIISAPGDALITSASLIYHGPLDDRSRKDLMSDWLNRIKQNAFSSQGFMGTDLWSETASFPRLIKPDLQQNCASKTSSDFHAHMLSHSEVNCQVPLQQKVKTFKYKSALYESKSYYKSELKRQDTVQTAVPEDLADDSDEDENCLLPTRPNLALQEILSDFDELSEWRKQNLPTDLHSVHNALIMRVCCHNRKHSWPLLIDPDNQAEMWVRILQNNQNFFTERDVASFLTDDDIPVERSSYQESEEILGSPLYSRGTSKIFSDTTDNTATNTSTVGVINRQVSQSCCSTGDTGNQTVTQVSSAFNSFTADSDLDFSKDSVWVLMTDDPNFNSKLISAVVHGATVLVTHLERKPLDQLFSDLLLKQFSMDRDGNKIVKIGGMAFTFHPSFCLYLSISVPLFVKGDGIFTIPLNHLCVINMAMSDEAIINRLMLETMKVEKKEFESQRRSNENDIILHRQQLAKEYEIIREKTLNFPGPLLDDKTMLNSLMAFLEETLYMGDHLEGKFSHYMPFIRHSAMLYCVMNKMSALHPDYYLALYKFVEIFSAAIRSRDRGKESIGAPEVRAQELSDAVLEAVFRYVRLLMFEGHYCLLALLVSLERLLRQHKASSKELGLFVNGFMKNGSQDASLLKQKPQWMDTEAWQNCKLLESFQQPFDGLCDSLVKNCQQWEEYFQNLVSLVSPVPGPTLQELSLFQKCLLWKMVYPQKRMAELSQALILCELGSAVKPPENYDINEVYKLTDKHTPTCFILPSCQKRKVTDATTGYPFTCPITEVKQLARKMGMEGKVRIMNFAVTSQNLEVKNALKDCLHKGHWLLLHNYHLCQEPDPEFFTILKDIIYAQWHEEDQTKDTTDVYGEDWSLVTRSRPSSSVRTNDIHQSFRLWITTRANEERALPGLIIQHGLRVTCETTANFKSLLKKTYKSAENFLCSTSRNSEEMMHSFNRVMPLALLHAIVQQQSYYRCHAFVHHPFWTLTDLAAVTDTCYSLSALTTDNNAIADIAACVYVAHCQDMSDSNPVNAVIKELIHYSTLAKKVSFDEIKGVGLLLHKLVTSFKETGDLQKTLDSIEPVTAETICLPEEIHEHFQACKSSILLKELIQTVGEPEFLLSTQKLSGDPAFCQAMSVISSMQDILSACPELPETSLTQIVPLYSFFSQEVAAFKELLQSVQNDLHVLNKAANGLITLTPKMQFMLQDICNDDIPATWLQTTFATCSSLKSWILELPTRISYVKNCWVQCPVILSLNMFLRPDKLLWAILKTFAQQDFKEITDIFLDFQVMPQGLSPISPPDRGVYLDGLQLKNASWDSIKSVLSENTLCSHKEHLFPVLWAKPCRYLCPAYSARDSQLHNDQNIFWTIPLASLKSPTFWSQKRVAFTLSAVKP